jgi:hypothetical protein
MRSKNWVLHPFLFAVYPVLSLYSHNLSQLFPAAMIMPTAVYLGVTVTLWTAFGLFSRSNLKGALMASAVLGLSLVLGCGFEWLDSTLVGKYLLDEYRYAWAVMTLGILYGLFRFSKNTPVPRRLTITANVVALVLILQPLTKIGWNYRQGLFQGVARNHGAAPATPARQSKGLPDIYYIILDGYARQDVLSKYFGHDNQPFVDRLHRMGFEVMPQGRCNYGFTALSLASSLNMTYINQLSGVPEQDEESLRMIRESRVARELKSKGYRLIHFSSGWVVTGENIEWADLHLNTRRLDEYTSILVRTSLLRFFVGPYYYVPSQREILTYNLAKLTDIPNMPGPNFVFLHLVCPHPPFVFDRQGRLPDRNKAMRKLEADWLPPERYVDQLVFLNGRILEAVGRIIRQSSTPPVIILQADHGPACKELTKYPNPKAVAMRTSILNAYLLPRPARARLYPTITPVNTFRLIFDSCLGIPMTLLKDRTYYAGPIGVSPYTFIDVTNYRGAKGG